MAKAAKPTTKASPTRAQLAAAVCDGMLDGLSLRKSCIKSGVTISTFLRWVSEDEALAEHYTRAREMLLEHMREDLETIADEAIPSTASGSLDSAAVAKQRLQVDTRKWLLSKLAPKKYGDKVEQTLVGADGGDIKSSMTINVGFVGRQVP